MGLKEDFDKAATESKQLTKKPESDELLKLYALFKVAGDEDISKAPTPGTFDFKGKYKLNAWRELVDAKLSAEDAMTQYIALVEQLKVKYDFDASKQPETVGDS